MKNIPLTKKERLAIIAGIGVLTIGYFAYQSFAGTTLGVSLQLSGLLPGGTNINSGLVGHWTFDSTNMLQNVGDTSGQGNNGFLGGSTATTTVPGKIGQALNFNGSTNYVQANNSLGTLSVYSSCAWVRPNFSSNSSNNYGVMVRQSVNGDNNRAARITFQGSNHYWISDSKSAFSYSMSNSVASFNPGEWHHICFTFGGSSGTGQFYWDGIAKTTTQIIFNTGANNTANLPFYIGNEVASDYFDGTIDDVRIYNRVLSAAEVSRLYALGGGTHTGTSLQTSASPTGGNININSGLVGYWTFDGVNMKQNVVDSSGQGNTAYLLGYNSTSSVPGKVGQALSFDGVTNKVDVPSNNLGGPTNFTLAEWFNLKGVDTNGGEGLSLANATFIRFKTTGFEADYYKGGSAWRACSGGTDYRGKGWHHIAFTNDDAADTQKVYIDGALTKTCNFTETPVYDGSQGATDTTIGRNAGSDTTDDFRGMVDDARVYNRALSAAEISRLYQEGSSGATSDASVQTNSNTGNSLSTGLVGYWTFDGKNMFQNVVDSSGQGNTGYLTNFTSTTTVPGKIGQALFFNGTNNYVNVAGGGGLNNQNTASLSVWVKWNGTQTSGGFGYNGAVTGRQQDGNFSNDTLGLDAGNPATAHITFRSSQNDVVTSNVSPGNNLWHHIVVTYTSGTNGLNLYIDGVFNAQANESGSINNNSAIPLTIGGWIGAGNSYIKGSVDDVRIYNRVLSAAEVARLYQLGK